MSELERLRSIKTFPSLVKYLRDELDWPIEADDFEDLFFEYDAEELGIDVKTAAKIEAIKQLRPLVTNQPWGIFFIKFEPKRLPVVALRRILSQLVIKKRASSRKADQPAWHLNDILFISNYGEGDDRQITFAQFAQDEEKNDLPTLKVLGWDDADTVLHVDHVHRELKDKLRWPDNDKDTKGWREQWSSAFTLKHREVISTAKELAVRLADLARRIRRRTNQILAIETAKGPLRKLHKAFQTALIHDLKEDDFADMYAQTIAYGLLTARVTNPKGDVTDDLATHIPVTNPFLKELLETFLHVGGQRKITGRSGIDFDELGVSEIVELLDDAKMEDVLRDFGDRNPQEDPVIHFYELFLKEYDAKKRMQRGVFYTPRPVVSYIVRSVDELLRTEFGLADGLADTTTWGEMAKRHKNLVIPEGGSPEQFFVQILDPATGTGTFLVEVIDLIHRTLVDKWKTHNHSDAEINALWNEYVPKHLLPRLYGYELLMAPYAIAHLKIGLKLYETGYRFGSDERARIYLTNSLEPASDIEQQVFSGMLAALAHEAQAVNKIKRKQRFTVVIGNPPYAGHSANTGAWIADRMRDYYVVDGKPLGERNPKWLQDDYVKFMRFGQFCLQQSSSGVLAFITNHGYLENPTFRGMRQSFLKTFNIGYVVDLHGNVKKGQGGVSDQNVFDIQQGVAVGVWTRWYLKQNQNRMSYGDMMGDRSHKYNQLLRETIPQTAHAKVLPVSPFYLFIPQTKNLRDEFALGISLQSIFHVSTMGVTTGRDQLCVSHEEEEALRKIDEFKSNIPESELAHRFGLSNKSGWSIEAARKSVRVSGVSTECINAFAYRPFDVRVLYLDSAIVGRSRLDVMKCMMSGKNLALCTTRQVNGDFCHVICTRLISNDCLVSLASGERTYAFPLFYTSNLLNDDGLESNVNKEFLTNLATKLGWPGENTQWLHHKLGPQDVFYYVYSLLHSPTYRSRYSEFLKIEFPRLPLLGIFDLFQNLVRLGGELVALHLLESPQLNNLVTTYIGPKNPEVERVGWSDDTVWLDAPAMKKGQPAKPGTIGFRGVPEDVWKFHIGGYQVCEKWLKDRKGRTLSKDDIDHYQKIVVALSETIRIMGEIDEVIEEHGGWPGAFS